MRVRPSKTRLLAEGCAIVWLALACHPLWGGEKCRAFLDGLRAPRRGYYDVALDYLEAMRTSPMADRAFRETIDYEVGVTLLQAARLLPPDERPRQFDRAEASFKAFLEAHAGHSLATSANRSLAALTIDRAESKIAAAERLDADSPARRRQLDEARTLLQESEKSLTTIDEKLSKRLAAMKNIEKDDAARLAERDQMRSDIILTRLALANIARDTAKTFDRGGRQWRDALVAAAAKYNKYYWMYEHWLGGYAFRIEEAQCQLELGNHAAAKSILEELTSPQPDDDERARRVRTTAVAMVLPIDLLPRVKDYRGAWSTYENWETNTERPGESAPLAALIKYCGGVAALEVARSLDIDDPNEASLRPEYMKRAKELLSFVARSSSELRLKARVKLNDPLLVLGESFGAAPKSYEEARDLARIAWSQLQQSTLKPEQAARLRAQAWRYCRFAIGNAPADAKIDDLNFLRASLAYLAWSDQDYWAAVVLGEFLAQRQTDRPEAPLGARIALNAYDRLLAEAARGDDLHYETQRLNALAEQVVKRWPESPAAEDAWMILGRLAAQDHDVDRAAACLGRIADGSPRRADAELAIGHALWRAYVEAARLPDERQPTKAKMSKMLTEAEKAIDQGVARLRAPVDAGGEVPYALAVAGLTLAKIELDRGDGRKAVARLEDPKLGAYALVKKSDASADRGDFGVDALTTALRAYVATRQLDKAQATMRDLEKAAGDPLRLTRIYLGLGRQLEESLKRIRAEGRHEDAAAAARGFEFFLTRLAARSIKETNFDTLFWVAETFMNLGASMDSNDRTPTAEAQDYYDKAAETYRRILEACKADERFAPRAKAVDGVKLRLARCLRRLGKYEESLQALVEILTSRETVLDAQRDAALTFEVWGDETPERFRSAISGGFETRRANGQPANLVWGWSGIARRTQHAASLADAFHEARYHLALCRMNYALTRSDQEKADLLERAERDILIIQRLRPDMGGKKWYDQYDALLRKIQRFLGRAEDEQGLKAAERRASSRS